MHERMCLSHHIVISMNLCKQTFGLLNMKLDLRNHKRMSKLTKRQTKKDATNKNVYRLMAQVGLTTHMQNATLFERKGPECKPWPERASKSQANKCVFERWRFTTEALNHSLFLSGPPFGEKNLQGLKSWAWPPKFCRTCGVLQNLSSTGF